MYDYDFLAAAITDIMGDLEPGDSSVIHIWLLPKPGQPLPPCSTLGSVTSPESIGTRRGK